MLMLKLVTVIAILSKPNFKTDKQMFGWLKCTSTILKCNAFWVNRKRGGICVSGLKAMKPWLVCLFSNSMMEQIKGLAW